MGYRAVVCSVGLICVLLSAVSGQEVRVGDSTELRAALQHLTPGTTVLLNPGVYQGGLFLANATGTEDAPVVIQGTDRNSLPVFRGGGGQAFHFADCSHLILRNVRVEGFPGNGINIDDGGSYETPAHHITLEDVTILEIGPEGNYDALKMSGVDHFCVRNCRFEGWGGSGIDMVGCHHGVVEDCVFVGREGFSQSNAVQLKGGTEDVLVQCCLFRNAGQRSINLGGSTGLQFFRPQVRDYEARNITIAGNRFEGSISPIAWVTADGGHVHHNTMVLPDKWALRILQETTDAQFQPCHGGVFEDNLVFYDSRVQVFVNVGPGTSPETFVFRRNAWCDVEGSRKPSLPVTEDGGVYLSNVGAEAYKRVQ
ncbi:MAG: right-handed parallel beta-helix repeat-containing protein [Phycisphaerales bacterium]